MLSIIYLYVTCRQRLGSPLRYCLKNAGNADAMIPLDVFYYPEYDGVAKKAYGRCDDGEISFYLCEGWGRTCYLGLLLRRSRKVR